MKLDQSKKHPKAMNPLCGFICPLESLRRAGALWHDLSHCFQFNFCMLLHQTVTSGRYELLLYLLDSSTTEIDGTRMSIDFFVDPEAAEPYAGEVSVGCSAMPQVQALFACNVLAACVFMS